VDSQLEDNRKYFTPSKEKSPLMPNLTLPPTNVWTSVILVGEDYGLKASITYA
jgi:hypothetical protein